MEDYFRRQSYSFPFIDEMEDAAVDLSPKQRPLRLTVRCCGPSDQQRALRVQLRRKKLYDTKRRLATFMMVQALVGIALMICETELVISGIYEKSSLSSIALKSVISLSTASLVISVVLYHICDIKMYLIENSLSDWHYAVTFKRFLCITLELLICAMHPPPGNHDFEYDIKDKSGNVIGNGTYPVDVFLSLPMFLRVYLFCRFGMLHAPLFSDAKSQSLGALNRIHINFAFVFKAYMTMYPGRLLPVIICTVYVVGSWSVRACEMYMHLEKGSSHRADVGSMSNAFWLIAITVLTVGYGDVYPNTTCSRTISVISGALGVACTALVVAVLTKMLELNRKEAYVHSFVLDVHLEKRYKHCAQLVVREAWKAYKWRKLGNGFRVRLHTHKLLKAIVMIRKVREKRNRVKDSDIALNELSIQQTTLQGMLYNVLQRQSSLATRLEVLEDSLRLMTLKVADVHSLILPSHMPSPGNVSNGPRARVPLAMGDDTISETSFLST